jgi:hypothetical protein
MKAVTVIGLDIASRFFRSRHKGDLSRSWPVVMVTLFGERGNLNRFSELPAPSAMSGL